MDCEKYSPGSGPQWQVDMTRFPALYKALIDKPEARVRKEKRDSWTCVQRTPTRVKRVGRTLTMRDIEGRLLLTQ